VLDNREPIALAKSGESDRIEFIASAQDLDRIR